MSWWSNRYNRPLKDPILMSYSIEELAYEFYLHSERERAEAERTQQENDKIEETKTKQAESWADQMEKEDEEAGALLDPSKDIKNMEWMKQEIENNKKEFGEDFGEDLNIDFEGV